MRSTVVMLLSFTLLAGCSRKQDPLAKGFPEPVAGAWATNPAAPPPYDPVFLEQQSADLAEQLKGPDPVARAQAATQLAQLGKPGFDELVKGMESPVEDVRVVSLQSVPRRELVENHSKTIPLLLRMATTDPNPEVRRGAASRLGWYGKAGERVIPQLQQIARNDPDAGVRQTAEIAIIGIVEVLTGKPISGGPDDPKTPKK